MPVQGNYAGSGGVLHPEDYSVPTILIVDHDRRFLDILRRFLVDAGYQVITATDGHAALAEFQAQRPDVVVLEWQLPGLDRIAVIRRIRETDATPILMLAARATIEDRVTALDSGADDYLAKPYNPAELLAHMRALLRRTHGPGNARVLTYADLVLDPVTRETRRGTRHIVLSPRECGLLTYLLSHPRQVLPRQQIMLAVWGYDFGDTNVLEVYIGYLRKKLEAGGEPRLIQTIRGTGYVLREA